MQLPSWSRIGWKVLFFIFFFHSSPHNNIITEKITCCLRGDKQKEKNTQKTQKQHAFKSTGPDTWHNPATVGPFPGNKYMHGIQNKTKKTRQANEKKKNKTTQT